MNYDNSACEILSRNTPHLLQRSLSVDSGDASGGGW